MNSPLRILMIHQGTELYGSDRSFASSVHAVREQFPSAQIDVVLPGEGPLLDIIRPSASRFIFEPGGILRKIEIKRSPFQAIARLIATSQIYRRLFFNYDIFYVNTVVCVSAIFALRNQPSNRKFVHVREIPSRFQRRIFGALLRYSKAKIIYNSNETAKSFEVEGNVVYNGVSKPGLKEVSYKTKSSPIRLLIVGRVNLWKGQQFVLDAISRYGRNINAHIRIVGDVFPGYEYLLDDLHKTASDCVQQIDFIGFSNEIASEIAWSDFVLVPSILPEPFGRVAIESFAVGRPVIASNGGGLCEIVTDNVDGFLFEQANDQAFVQTLRRAISLTEEQYREMCTNAEEKYERKFTEKYYKECIAEAISHALDSETVL